MNHPASDFDEELDLVSHVYLDSRPYDNGGKIPIPVYQFVYGSELYGTLFGVFAKFEVAPIDPATKKRRVTSIRLKLFNYKGILNIGFLTDEGGAVVAPTFDDTDPHRKTISFFVQGTSPSRQTEITFKPGDSYIDVEKDVPFRLIFKRILRPLPDFINGPQGQDTNTPIPPSSMPNSNLFDTEFYDRSGSEFYNRPIHPGTKSDKSKEKIMFPSARCYEGIVNLIY